MGTWQIGVVGGNSATYTNKLYLDTENINTNQISFVKFEQIGGWGQNYGFNAQCYLTVYEMGNQYGFGVSSGAPGGEAVYLTNTDKQVGWSGYWSYGIVSGEAVRSALGTDRIIYGAAAWLNSSFIDNFRVTIGIINQIGVMSFQTNSGLKQARIYSPDSIANPRLRVQTAARGVGCLNLVDPSIADTGVRIHDGNAIRGIKTYMSSAPETVDKQTTPTEYGQDYTETFYTGNSYYHVYPNYLPTPMSRVYGGRFYLAIYDNSYYINRAFYLYIHNGSYWFNTGITNSCASLNNLYYTASPVTFAETDFYKWVWVPTGNGGGGWGQSNGFSYLLNKAVETVTR